MTGLPYHVSTAVFDAAQSLDETPSDAAELAWIKGALELLNEAADKLAYANLTGANLAKDAVMGTPWTPGPWHVSLTHDGQSRDIGAHNNDNVALIYGPTQNGSDKFCANARLIAEAPAMAAALEDALFALVFYVLELNPEWDGAGTPDSTIGKIRAILARIKGETS